MSESNPPERGVAFVAGATGYTGREVVRECVARGLRTIAHVRPDSRELERWRTRFGVLGAEVDTTPWELDAMTARLSELVPTQLYALLGTTNKRGKRGSGSVVVDTHEAVDYGLTILLLEASMRVRGASGARPVFVYLSAMGAERPINSYMAIRKRVEAALRGSGLPFVIARPGFITGSDREESRPAERAAAKVGDGLLGVLRKLGAGKLADAYTSMTGAELAHALVELAHRAGPDSALVAEASELRALASTPA